MKGSLKVIVEKREIVVGDTDSDPERDK